MSESRTPLEVENLSKTYGAGPTAVHAIEDLSFTVEPSEVVTVVGPSGAGKTTLLRCLTGLLAPTSGVRRIYGREYTTPPPEIGLIFQDYGRSLMPWYTVAKNVELPIKKRIKDKAERQERVSRALMEVGLADAQDRFPWQLSGGMQQRVALARGLAYAPEILLLDEPFASVDAQTRADLEDLVLGIHQATQLPFVFVTHDIDEAVYLADRVVVLSGRPAVVNAVVAVDLPRPRGQLTTKSDPRFAELRADVLRLVQQSKGPRLESSQGMLRG
jgi:NitT/TauT family transport system ATP-binding protein